MLLGRDVELGRVRALVDSARAGHGGALLVAGEAGIGKTVLVREAVAGASTVWLAGVEAERDLPYAALTMLASPLRRHIERLGEQHRDAVRTVLGLHHGDDPGRLLLGMSVLALLTAAARDDPLIVVIDDLQWVDPPSRDALLFVARRLRADRVAMIATLRDGVLSDSEAHLLGGLEVLDLVGLDEAAAARLLPGAHAHTTRALVVRTGGNPLAMIESLADLDPDVAEAGRALPRMMARTGPEQVYAERLTALSGDVRRAARLAALAADCPRDVLMTALADAGLVLDHLSPVEVAGLVSVEDHIVWRHPLARSAAARGTSVELASAHRHLAAGWERVSPRNPARAWHLAESVQGVDEPACALLVEAAELAEDRGASADAATAYERAAAHAAPGDVSSLLVRAGRAAASAGRCETATALIDRVRTDDPDAVPLDVLTLRAGLAGPMGDHELAACLWVDVARVDEFAAGRAQAACQAMLWARWSGRHDLSREALDIAVAAHREDAGPLCELAEHFCRASFALVVQDIPGCRRAGDDARRVFTDHPDLLRSDPTLVRLSLGIDLMGATGHPVSPEEREALDRLRLSGEVTALASAAHAAMVKDAFAGLWQHVPMALREVELLARLAGQRGVLCDVLQEQAEDDALAGLADACLTKLDEVRRLAGTEPSSRHHAYHLYILARLHLSQGETVAAIENFRATVATTWLELEHALPELIAVLHDERSPAAAAEEVERHAHLKHHETFPLATALASEDLGVACRAVDEYIATRSPMFDAGFYQLHLGRRARLLGQRDLAVTRLEDALVRFRTVDAQPWIDRAEDELRAAGQRVQGTDRSQALTVAERRVAELVGEGRSNKEVAALLFVSPKTVEFHLSSAYRKFGVTNRTALARALARD